MARASLCPRRPLFALSASLSWLITELKSGEQAQCQSVEGLRHQLTNASKLARISNKSAIFPPKGAKWVSISLTDITYRFRAPLVAKDAHWCVSGSCTWHNSPALVRLRVVPLDNKHCGEYHTVYRLTSGLN